MKNGATPNHKGLKSKTSEEKRVSPKTQGARKDSDPLNQKSKNRYLDKASLVHLTLEGEGDTFQLKLLNHTKATH
jgi:hypothetical protein